MLSVSRRGEAETAGEAGIAVGSEGHRPLESVTGERGFRHEAVAGSVIAPHQGEENPVCRLLDCEIEHDRRGSVGAIDAGGDRSGSSVDAIGIQLGLDAAVRLKGEGARHLQRGGAACQLCAKLQPRDVELPGSERKQSASSAASGAFEARLARNGDAVGADRVEGDAAGEQCPDIEVDRQSVNLGEGPVRVGKDDLVGPEGERRPAR